MLNILFVCTANTCRSPMAEFIAKNIFKHENLEAKVNSAGTITIDGEKVSENAVNALTDLKLLDTELKNEILEHRSKAIDFDMIIENDFIFTMTYDHMIFLTNNFPEQQKKIFVLGDFACEKRHDVIDPFGGDLEIYKKCALEIYDLIYLSLKKIPKEFLGGE